MKLPMKYYIKLWLNFMKGGVKKKYFVYTSNYETHLWNII